MSGKDSDLPLRLSQSDDNDVQSNEQVSPSDRSRQDSACRIPQDIGNEYARHSNKAEVSGEIEDETGAFEQEMRREAHQSCASWAIQASDAEKARDQDDHLLRIEYLNREEEDAEEQYCYLLRAHREEGDHSRDISPTQLWRQSADWEEKLEARVGKVVPVKYKQVIDHNGKKKWVVDNEDQAAPEVQQAINAVAKEPITEQRPKNKASKSSNYPPEQGQRDRSNVQDHQRKDRSRSPSRQSRFSDRADAAPRTPRTKNGRYQNTNDNHHERRGREDLARGDVFWPSR